MFQQQWIWQSSWDQCCHSQRDAWADTWKSCALHGGGARCFHCFGGSFDQANEVLDLDHLVRSREFLTSKRCRRARVAADIALEIYGRNRLPISGAGSVRGKRCDPRVARIVAEASVRLEGCTQRNCGGNDLPQARF